MSDGQNAHPFDFAEARAASTAAAVAQQETISQMRGARIALADAEREYRRALAVRILRAKAVEDIAWTVAGDIARGDDEVSELRHARDLAAGTVKALEESTYRHAADRRDLHDFVTWSRSVSPLGEQLEDPRKIRGGT